MSPMGVITPGEELQNGGNQTNPCRLIFFLILTPKKTITIGRRTIGKGTWKVR